MPPRRARVPASDGEDEEPSEVLMDDETQQGEEEQDEDEPNPKRARMDEMAYRRGTIKKIRVHNFMTYAGSVTIQPGPRLNLVLGPNGTGKSSLVCALCVGLAGHTKLLGRADNLADYVRRGCDKAWTEITLSSGGDGPDIIIRRDIKITKSKQDGQTRITFSSSYKINNVDRTEKEVKDKVAHLKIQMDNLCQFLPQDKVVEFANMNAVELLEATEKALGDSHLYDTHQKLIKEREQIKEQQQVFTRRQAELERLKSEHERQRRDYERFAQRERLKQEAELMDKKIKFLRYEQAKETFRADKDALRIARQQLDERVREETADEQPQSELDKRMKVLKQKIQEVHRKAAAMNAQLSKGSEEGDKLQDALDEALSKQTELKQEHDKWLAGIAELEAKIRRDQEEASKIPQGLAPELEERYKDLGRECRELQEQVTDREEQIPDLRSRQDGLDREQRAVEGRLKQLRDVRYQMLSKCEEMNRMRARGVREMHDWIAQNRQLFKGPVFGPLCCEMSMREQGAWAGPPGMWARYIEQQCGGQMYNFCVATKEDEILLSEMLNKFECTSSVNCYTDVYDRPIPHPLGDASQYSSYGITHSLDELFEAPPLVKHVLCDLTKIHITFVAHEMSEPVVKELFEKTRMQTVFSGGLRLGITRSQYNRAADGISEEEVRPARLLTRQGLVASKLEEEVARLEEQRRTILRSGQDIKADYTRIEGEIRELKAQMEHKYKGMQQIEKRREDQTKKRGQLHMEIKLNANRMEREKQRPDPLSKKGKLDKELEEAQKKMLALGKQQVKLLQDLWPVVCAKNALDLGLKEAEAQIAALRRATDDRRKAVVEARALVQKAEAIFERARRTVEDRKQEVLALNATAEDKQAMLELPNSVDDLAAERDRKNAEADGIVCNDENVVHEYQARQVNITDLQQTVDAQVVELTTAQEQLIARRDTWLPDLKQLVGIINDRFSANFAEIGCAGEISLKEDEDFDKFAIQIRVKFRAAEEMQLLTAHRQSGGERSVSTILYLIALQGVTETPFRVVDEINQGMDPINERKVFIQLVESACKPDTPQCFLLTPKLLPGLPFTRDITVLNIMNGPHIEDQLIKGFSAVKGMGLYGKRYDRFIAAGGGAHGIAAH